jgi:hypothetical protein
MNICKWTQGGDYYDYDLRGFGSFVKIEAPTLPTTRCRSSTLKVKAADPSEIPVTIYNTTRRHISEDSHY